MSSPKPRRRWYQFGLSTLLIGLTLISLPLGYIAWEREQCRRGQQALDALGDHFFRRSPEHYGYVGRPETHSSRSDWVKVILGDDQYREVEFADLIGDDVSDNDMQHFASLPNLRGGMIVASNVTDKGVANLRSLKSMEMLYFIRNQKVSGKSWGFLAEWDHLRNLGIEVGSFDDEGASNLSTLTNLEKLCLSKTRVTDVGLKGISSLTSLEVLELGDTELTDVGLRHLSKLINLRELDLEGTSVVGPGLLHLAALPKIELLNLSRSNITDEGLANLARLTNLKRLSLDGTPVTDAGLAHLSGLKSLERLWLDTTKVSDEGLLHLRQLTNLEHVFLSGTSVTPAGAMKMKKSLPKTWFHLKWREPGHGE